MKTMGKFAMKQDGLSVASRDAEDRNKYVGQDGVILTCRRLSRHYVTGHKTYSILTGQ
jgi:hypothetical protein